LVLDHLTKRKIMNTGQLPQYYVRDSHEAIIDRDTFAAVQTEIAHRVARHQPNPQPPPVYPLAGLVKCGICGAPYRHKIAGSAPKYKKPVWICETYNTLGKARCPSQQIPDRIMQVKLAEAGGMEGLKQIIAIRPGVLSFKYIDGKQVDIPWINPSRRESWTPEMREAARQKESQRRRNHGQEA
jgi:hypothetical protein